eukprot:scaffold71877_cov24-Attheya_sp.AAC.2
MESDSSSADDGDKRSGAGSNKRNTDANLKAKNEELEKKIELFSERERKWDELYEENEDIRDNLQNEVVRLNKAVKDLNEEIRVVEEQTLSAHDNSGIEMDAVEYDRVCCYVRKTLFRKVKFTLDKALDSVKKGSICYTISDVFNIHEDDRWSWWQCYKQAAHHGIAQARNGKITEIKNCYKRAKTMFEENNQQMPTLDELLQLREEPRWSEQDDRRIVNNNGFVFMVDFMYGSLIGKRQWKKDKLMVRLSSELTISDEAFVLLVLENNWDVFNGVASAEPK